MASLLNDVSQTTRLSELLAGSAPLLSDAAVTDDALSAATSIVSDGDSAAGSQMDAGESSLVLAGPGGTAQPVFDDTNFLVKDVHAQLETTSHQVGLSNLVHGLTNLGETAGVGTTGAVPPASDGHTNLVTDVVNLPSEVAAGQTEQGVNHIAQDGGDTINAATGLVSAAVNPGDPLNPVPNLVNAVASDAQHVPLASGGSSGLLGIAPAGNGLLDGTAGDLNHSSSGHLIDLDLGPQQANGTTLNVLSSGDSAGSMASVNAVDVGSNGPHLLDAALLTDAPAPGVTSGGLAGSGVQNVLGGGADSLVGGLTGDHTPALSLAANTDGNASSAPALVEVHPDAIAPDAADHGLLNVHGSHII